MISKVVKNSNSFWLRTNPKLAEICFLSVAKKKKKKEMPLAGQRLKGKTRNDYCYCVVGKWQKKKHSCTLG